jgi:hypothetical protein
MFPYLGKKPHWTMGRCTSRSETRDTSHENCSEYWRIPAATERSGTIMEHERGTRLTFSLLMSTFGCADSISERC